MSYQNHFGGYYVFHNNTPSPSNPFTTQRRREEQRCETKLANLASRAALAPQPVQTFQQVKPVEHTAKVEPQVPSTPVEDTEKVKEVLDMHVIKPAGLEYYKELALW